MTTKKINPKKFYANQDHAKRNFVSHSNRYLSELNELYTYTPRSKNIEDVLWTLYLLEARRAVREAIVNVKAAK